MQKSSIAKYGLSVALFILLAALTFVPSRFPAQSQGSFTPTPTTTPTPEMIESDFDYVSQAGQWTSQAASSASGGGYLYSGGSVDDTLMLEFEGTTVTIIYVEGSSLGTFAIEIDNTVVRTVITTNSTTNYNVQAVVDYLSAGHHTLKVYSTEGVIAVDAFYTIVDVPQLDLSSQTPPPTEGEGSASGATNDQDGVWAKWAAPDFNFDAVYAPTSGCPSPYDLNTRNTLLARGLYAEVDTRNDFISAINRANDNQTQSPFLICITTLSPITLNQSFAINNSVNIYGQIGRANLVVSTNLGSSPLFTINAGALVEMSHIAIDTSNRSTGNPVVAGGAIVNHGKLSIFDSQLSGNQAFTSGGAIVNSGSLYVARTLFSGNSTIRDTYFEGSGGGAVHNDWGGVFIAHCDEFTDNHAYTAGAAILNGFHNRYTSILHIWRTAFSENMLGNGYYFQTYGDILNGPIGYTNSNGSNAHYSTYIRADGVTIMNQAYTSPLEDPSCAPLSPPRLEVACVVKVNASITLNAYLSPVPARTEKIQNLSFVPPYETAQATYSPDDQLWLAGSYGEGYIPEGATDEEIQLIDGDIVKVVARIENPADPLEYDPEEWTEDANYTTDANDDYQELWINLNQGTSPDKVTIVGGEECDLVSDLLPVKPYRDQDNIEMDNGDNYLVRHDLIEDLREYGIEIRERDKTGGDWNRQWTNPELGEVTAGVEKTALALWAFKNDSDLRVMTLEEKASILPEAKRVFDNILVEGSAKDYFTLLRVQNGAPGQIGCNAPNPPQNTACTDNGDSLIGFWGNIGSFGEHLVVHELGHRFDYKSEQGEVMGLSDYVEETQCGNITEQRLQNEELPPNCQVVHDFSLRYLTSTLSGITIVMGPITDPLDRTVKGWIRGGGGWGTGPASEGSNIFEQNGQRKYTDFQQHPPPYPQGEDRFDETAADMFLNWVYRKYDDSGFLKNLKNWTWDPRQSDEIGNCYRDDGCEDKGNPGDIRFGWIESKIEIIFDAQSW